MVFLKPQTKTVLGISIYLFLALVCLVTAGGYVQVFNSGLYWCGKYGAGGELWLWIGIAFAQLIGFFADPISTLSKTYRISQLLLAPVLVLVVVQLGSAHGSTFLLLGSLGALPICFALLIQAISGHRMKWLDCSSMIDYIIHASIYVMAVAVFFVTLSLWVLYSRNIYLSNTIYLVLLICSLAGAFVVVRGNELRSSYTAKNLLPVSLLLIIFLRAKLPDNAFDTLLYKGTSPLMLADWRTAITGTLDHTLLGTNFQEILNALIRIGDPTYNPSLISSLAFAVLWLVVIPVCYNVAARLEIPALMYWGNFAGASIFCLTEGLIANGTTYHEPLLIAFLVLSLLPTSIGWIFFAAACAVNFLAVIALPAVAVIRLLAWRRELHGVGHIRFIRLMVFTGFAVLVLGSHLYRNFELTGRVLAPAGTLSSVTDPGGHILANTSVTTLPACSPQCSPQDVKDPDIRFLVNNPGMRLNRGGLVNNMILSSLNIWGLDVIIPTTFKGSENFGFHVLPSSRWPLLGVLISIALMILAIHRRSFQPLFIAAAYLAGYVEFHSLFTQGRYFTVLSFSAVLLLFAALYCFRNRIRIFYQHSHWAAYILPMAGALVIGTDLLPGVMINDGWICNRNLLTPVSQQPIDQVQTNLDIKLVELTKKARASGSRIPPTIFAEHAADIKPYLSTHYVFSFLSTDLTLRYLAADPQRSRHFPNAVLAIVYKNPKFLEGLGRYVDLSAYSEYFREGDMVVIASNKFLQGEPSETLITHPLGLFEIAGWMKNFR